jgi:phosphoglycolate phosphatase
MTEWINQPHWIFFDLDGTLADSLPGLRLSIAEAFAATGRTLPDVDLRPHIGPGVRSILRNLDATITDEELDRMELVFRASYDTRGVLDTALFPEVDATLRGLRADGHELFIITNKPKLATATLLGKLGLSELFTDIVSRNSRDRPYASKTEMLADTVEHHGADPARSVMVGDTLEDLHAAEAAGMRFVHATYGYGTIPRAGHTGLQHFAQIATLCAAAQE